MADKLCIALIANPLNLPLFGAWILSLTATGGALFIGEVLGQTPCDLCWFQRAFMFPLAVILGIAVLKNDWGAWRYGVPLAFIGATIAAYHSLLYSGAIAEPIRACTETGPSCTDAAMAILGFPIPYLSLASFVAIIGLLMLSRIGD